MADKLHGNWLNVSEGRPLGYPDLIRFNNGTIMHSLLKDNSNNLEIPIIYKEECNETIISFEKIQTITPNRIRIFRKGIRYSVIDGEESKRENVVFENDYVRLLPTKANISESRIQLCKYEVKWNNENIIFEFNKILDKPYIQEINKKLHRKGRIMLLEKLDETLVVSMFSNNQRGLILPIKEVNEEKIILYGFPEEPYEVIGNRIGE